MGPRVATEFLVTKVAGMAQLMLLRSIAALFTRAKRWAPPYCLPVDEPIRKTLFFHPVGKHLVLKRKKNLSQVVRLHLADTVLNHTR